MIDLRQDSNHDGVPDALVNEVQRIKSAQDKNAAIADFVSRLPYSPETRALQKQSESLQQQLAGAKNNAEAQPIINQLHSLEERMRADPNYVRATEGLRQMIAPPDVERTNGSMSRRHSSNTLLAFAKPVGSMTDVGLGMFRKPNAVPPTKQRIAAVNWNAMQAGDIILVHSDNPDLANYVYAQKYEHVANYADNNQIYQSTRENGVRLQPLSNLQQTGISIGLAYDKQRSRQQVQDALKWAEGKYGTNGETKYNYNFADKSTDGSLYCSQLTWKIHKHIGVNLDSNDSVYLAYIAAKWTIVGELIAEAAVAPDEIALSPNVTVYDQGNN